MNYIVLIIHRVCVFTSVKFQWMTSTEYSYSVVLLPFLYFNDLNMISIIWKFALAHKIPWNTTINSGNGQTWRNETNKQHTVNPVFVIKAPAYTATCLHCVGGERTKAWSPFVLSLDCGTLTTFGQKYQKHIMEPNRRGVLVFVRGCNKVPCCLSLCIFSHLFINYGLNIRFFNID